MTGSMWMRTAWAAVLLTAASLTVCAQADRREVRQGNRLFRKGEWASAEIAYRKAQVKDTASFAASYNLASSLYRQQRYEDAGAALDAVKESAPGSVHAADWYFNQGDVALQKKDYKAAVDAFREALLRRPDDLEAKENYIYAKLMLKEEGNDGGGQDQNQDQDQNQNQDQDQNQDQNQNQDQGDGQDPGQPQEQKISPQQAQQMLKAIQAKEKETQEKVGKEKAALLKSRQKEKNW